jgi:hypothetical protein
MPAVLVEPDPCLVSGGEVAILQEPRPADRQPPHRPRSQLLAQPTKNPGPVARESVTDDATHV